MGGCIVHVKVLIGYKTLPPKKNSFAKAYQKTYFLCSLVPYLECTQIRTFLYAPMYINKVATVQYLTETYHLLLTLETCIVIRGMHISVIYGTKL